MKRETFFEEQESFLDIRAFQVYFKSFFSSLIQNRILADWINVETIQVIIMARGFLIFLVDMRRHSTLALLCIIINVPERPFTNKRH